MSKSKLMTKTKLLRTITTSTLTTGARAAEQSCLSLLQSCNTFPKLAQIHTHILKLGLHSNPLVLTKFTSTSADLKALDYACSFLFSPDSDTRLYDAFLFNTVIRAYARSGDFSKDKAIRMYNFMLKWGVLPNKFTYPFVLKACAGIGELKLGQSVHGSVLKFGFEDDAHVQNTMLHMYFYSGGIEFARKVFDKMPKLDSVTWSVMIGGYVHVGQSNEAVELFRKMQMEGVCPDEITMVSVLSACTDLGAFELGKWMESLIEKERVPKTVELSNALIEMFAKCGDVDKALNLFRNMSERTIVSWTSVIVGLAMHGRGMEAVVLFEEMMDAGMPPDDVVFIGLFTACSHSGLVEKGKQYFDLMTKRFQIVPKMEHYGCMVDLLCRDGRVKEALEFVLEMPLEPNPIVWRTLISACHAHGDLKLGEEITKWLIGKEPMQESNYVLLSNIYANMDHWEKKTKIRELMGKKGMKKAPGSTLIELSNDIRETVGGHESHCEYSEMSMGREVKKAGYLPTMSEVLLDINGNEKGRCF